MNKTYTKKEFTELDIDSKCVIMESLLEEEYFKGQSQISFYFPPNFEGGTDENLPVTPPDIQRIQDEKLEELVTGLTEQLFESQEKIEFDFEHVSEELSKD